MPLSFLRRVAVATVLLANLLALPPAVAGDPEPTRRLHALFDASWEDSMRRSPEWATYVGDDRYGDRLQDASPAAEAEAFAETRGALQAARAIQRDTLAPSDRVSLDIFIYNLEENLRFEPFKGYRSLSLGALGGFQSDFAALLTASPVETRVQVEQMLARLVAYPRRVDQEVARLREGQALG